MEIIAEAQRFAWVAIALPVLVLLFPMVCAWLSSRLL